MDRLSPFPQSPKKAFMEPFSEPTEGKEPITAEIDQDELTALLAEFAEMRLEDAPTLRISRQMAEMGAKPADDVPLRQNLLVSTSEPESIAGSESKEPADAPAT